MEDVFEQLFRLVKEHGLLGVLLFIFTVLSWRAIPYIAQVWAEDQKDRRYHQRELEDIRARLIQRQEEEEK